MSVFKRILPPPGWRLPVAVVLGILLGLSLYLFKASNAVSYLSDEPETCINCHVMNPQYATWNHSSHREHATCNDCHVPHDNVFHKYAFKAKDGLRHAKAFTLRQEPQVIQIKEEGIKVVQENCKRCHESLNENISAGDISLSDVHKGNGKLCWECHREVPHGTVKSLSVNPNALVPEQNETSPKWLKDIVEKNDNNSK